MFSGLRRPDADPGVLLDAEKGPDGIDPGILQRIVEGRGELRPQVAGEGPALPGSPSTMSGRSVCGCLLSPRASGTAEYQWSSPMIANLMEVTSSPQIASRPCGDRVSEEY